jgi:hypothetical protein
LKILQFLSILKEKKQDCLKFSIGYQETKLFDGYFSHPNELFYLDYTITSLVFVIHSRTDERQQKKLLEVPEDFVNMFVMVFLFEN